MKATSTLEAWRNARVVRDMAAQSFGGVVKREREARGLSVTDLARRAGVATYYVENVESGKRWPIEGHARALHFAIITVTPRPRHDRNRPQPTGNPQLPAGGAHRHP